MPRGRDTVSSVRIRGGGVLSNATVNRPGYAPMEWVAPPTGSQTSDAAFVQVFLSGFVPENPERFCESFPACDGSSSESERAAGPVASAFRDEVIRLMLLTQ